MRRLRDLVSTSPVVEVFAPAGFGSSRIVSEALDGHRRVTTLRVDVIDSSTPLLAVRRLVEALGGVGAWESTRGMHSGIARSTLRLTTTGAGVEATASIARDLEQLWPPELVVVIDGHHHLDEASWSVIRAVATTLQATPQGRRLVLTGRRPTIGTNAVQLEVGPLDASDVRKIVIDASDRPLSDADLVALVDTAAGSPLLAQELARLGPRSDLPPTLEALVASRIDRLPAAVARAVRTVAVIGPSCTVADAVAITEIALHRIRRVAGQSDGTMASTATS